MDQDPNYYITVADWISKAKLRLSIEEMRRQLRIRFSESNHQEEREALGHYLRMEYERQNQTNDAREILLELISDQPRDPIRWIGLAGFEFVYSNMEASLDAAETAVNYAREGKVFLRYALNTKARALRYVENYQELDNCLVEIANLIPREGESDFPSESDFFLNLDKSKIRPSTVELYQAYLDRWKGKSHPAWDDLAGQ